jgi:hypothetical protein
MAEPSPDKPLKLRAVDVEDLSVLAACLQDAILPISDIAYLPAQRRFALVANRFRWERKGETHGFERVNCGICFENVRAAKLKRVDRRDRGLLLDLLTLSAEEIEGGYAVSLICADDRVIRLELDRIEVTAEDYGLPWPASAQPQHAEAPGAESPRA